MLKKAVAAGLALIMLGPSVSLVGIGVLMNPATMAECTTSDSPGDNVDVGDVPDELTAKTSTGESITLGKKQLKHAATIIQTGSKTDGVTRDGIQIALMAALTESVLKQLANTGTYPESGDLPNDGNGGDHDSLGLFQMRPQSGWGSVEELMDPEYQAQAFFGGPDGPNAGSPRGLLDIPGWEEMGKGEAAQSVEVSAFPDRYDNYEPVAEKILDTLSSATGQGTDAEPASTTKETSRIVFPLPEDTWTATSRYGYRNDPITGEQQLHAGSDYAAEDGAPIMAVADGTVTEAKYTDAGGGIVIIEHTIGGKDIDTAYIHMWEDGIHVKSGDEVSAGQHIADVGSSGHSTGAHLHLEVRENGAASGTTDPTPWLADHDAADLPEPDPGSGTGGGDAEDCADDGGSAPGGDPDPVEGDPNELVDDPTTDGQITRQMKHVYDEGLKAFPETSWSCWSERSGTKSEHPLGRACDITVGNPIGKRPTPAQLEDGWDLTNWMKDHAEDLGIDYLIWQGQIWALARDDEGWRDYNGGGMHDPSDITGGHYDHLHITVGE